MMQIKEEDVLIPVSGSKIFLHCTDVTSALSKGNRKKGQQRMVKLQPKVKSFPTDSIEIKTVESKMPKKRSKKIQIPEETKVCVPVVPSAAIKSKKNIHAIKTPVLVSTKTKIPSSTQSPLDINFKSIAEIQMKIEDALVKANIKSKPQTPRKEMKTYVCKTCDFRAYKLTDLKQHERKTHAGETAQKHRCQLCDRVYQSAAHLIRHSVVHSRSNNEVEVKPEVNINVTPESESVSNQKSKRFACLICKTVRSFTYQSGLVAHLARHLKGPIPDKEKKKVSNRKIVTTPTSS